MAYTKLWQKILTSSVWNEDLVTKVVWITMLALKDEKHMVLGSMGGVAHQARVSLDQCREAIAKLVAPDPDDSSKVAEGRRLIPVEGGWFVVNGERYRNSMDPDERRAIQAAYMRDYRARKATVRNVITGNNGSSHVIECKESEPSEQIRTEQSKAKENKPPTPLQGAVVFPVNLDSDRFKKAWNQWKTHRTEKRKKMTPTQEQKQLDRLEEWGPDRAIAAIDYSIAQGWTGIFEESLPLIPSKNGNQKPEAPRFVTYEKVATWCSRKGWTKLTEIAWGKLMGGTYYGRPITNEVDFNAAMSAIYEETEP